jgi:hypothetical protein
MYCGSEDDFQRSAHCIVGATVDGRVQYSSEDSAACCGCTATAGGGGGGPLLPLLPLLLIGELVMRFN